MTVVCIYHSACQDGFTAAWAVRAALGDVDVEYAPGVYQTAPPDKMARRAARWKKAGLV